MPGATSTRELAAGVTGGTRARRLYDEDVWAWSREQADALRRRDAGAIDWENVIEEIEDVGKRHSDAWTSYCANVISHLVKIERHGSTEDLRHWHHEVETWREDMYDRLEDGPGMKGDLDGMLATAWRRGRERAVKAMARYDAPGDIAARDRLQRAWRERLPGECPYALEDIVGYDPRDKDARPQGDVWPAPVARALNEGLGTEYPVGHRAPHRETGRSR